jgi:Anti-sigma-K factor rskA
VSAVRVPRNGDHETFDELAVGWALHALEPEDEALFVRHLPDCTRCATTVAESEEVMASLASELPPVEPTEALGDRLGEAVARTDQLHRPVLPPDQPTELPDDVAELTPTDAPRPTATPASPRGAFAAPWRAPASGLSVWRGRLPFVLGAAAAAAIVGLSSWNVVISTAREQAQTTAAEQAHIVDSLLTPGQATIAPLSDSDGRPVATVVARHGQVQIVTWGLSVNNPHAMTYVVWGMRQGSPVALGTFDVVQSGMDLRTVGSDKTGLDAFSGYAISIEPGRKAPSTPTDIVANGQVTS